MYLCYPFSLQYSKVGEIVNKLFNRYNLLLKMNRALNLVKNIKKYISTDGETIYSNMILTSNIRNIFLNCIHLKNVDKFDFNELYEM